MNRNVKNIILLTVFCTWAGMPLFAQQDTVLRQEVEVVKAYRPSISDAFKINDMPKIEREQHEKPTFDYHIFSQPVFSTFSVNPLQAAKIAGKPNDNHGYGLIKLGAGNYGKPYGELFLNNDNSRNTLFGMHFKHLSSHGKLKLAGGDKVEAPFSDNVAEMFVKHSGRNANLSFDASYNRDGFAYYGYPVYPVPEQLKEKEQNINYFGTKQAFSKGTAAFSIQNNARSSRSTSLGLDVKYHYFGTKTGQTEHFAEVAAHVRKPIDDLTAILDAGAIFYQADSIFNSSTDLISKRQEIWIKANPAVTYQRGQFSLRAGGKFYFVRDKDRDPAFRAAPDLLIKITPIQGILNFYAGVDGKYQLNNYSEIAYENPFVNPMHDVKNSMHRYRFFGGINGKFSSRINYTLSVGYSSIKDQPFFYQMAYLYPDVSAPVDPIITSNDFYVLYDELELTKASLEVYYTASEKLNVLLTGNYYSYNTKNEAEAWNMPAFDAKLSFGYQATGQLHVSADIYVIGERQSLVKEYMAYKQPNLQLMESIAVFPPTLKAYKLNAVVDLNVKANYALTQDFSIYGQLNNFGFQRYEKWLGYPVQGFNLLAGISYSF